LSEQPTAVVGKNLGAGYGSRPVWSHANFSVPPGSFTAILGPNGSGKSTLVRLILGLLPPSAGTIEVLGERPTRGNPRIGYVPQGSQFDPELSVRGRDFVGLGVDGHRWGVRVTGRAKV
jgi:zinc/manganese transport system ATP-binding protein